MPNGSRAGSAAAFGLVWMLGHSAVNHGAKESGDFIFDIIEEQQAKSELAGLNQSTDCQQ